MPVRSKTCWMQTLRAVSVSARAFCMLMSTFSSLPLMISARHAQLSQEGPHSGPIMMHACPACLLLCASLMYLLATECLWCINDALWHSMCTSALLIEARSAPVLVRILQQPGTCNHVLWQTAAVCTGVHSCLKWCSADGSAHRQAGRSGRSGLRCPAPCP